MAIKTATEQKSLLETLSPGKRTRLRRLLFEFGPGHGTLLLLPIDQGIEHGPRDFFPNPASKDPEYQFHLAAEAGYSAIACQIGLATKYYPDYAGQVPLILKINAKTDVPSSDEALSTTNASVEDAVRLGADAVGYTLYVGSPRQDADLHQLKGVREDCDRYGMPLVVWAYPRGAAIEKKGGHDSFYAIDYAARLAMEMGADVVKLNMPKIDPEKDKDSPAPYNDWSVSAGGGGPPRRQLGRPLARRPLGRLEDRRRRAARADALDHGGRRLGRDLRPQRLAARAHRGARDHRADQGDHALERHAHPVSAAGPPTRVSGEPPSSGSPGIDPRSNASASHASQQSSQSRCGRSPGAHPGASRLSFAPRSPTGQPRLQAGGRVTPRSRVGRA